MGVPQRSHLGPLLLTLYFNDIKHVIESQSHSDCIIYADNMKMTHA